MPRLPSLTSRDVIRALERGGFNFVRQKGSHRIFIKGSIGLTVPVHSKDMRKATLRHIIQQSRLSVEEFLRLI